MLSFLLVAVLTTAQAMRWNALGKPADAGTRSRLRDRVRAGMAYSPAGRKWLASPWLVGSAMVILALALGPLFNTVGTR